jgi:putative salt-induced outer membrane protein YdiY
MEFGAVWGRIPALAAIPAGLCEKLTNLEDITMGIMKGLNGRLASHLSWLVAMLLAATSLSADELVMKDGSRLMGKVGKQVDGTLEFETSYAGTIKVKWEEVSELHADKPVQVMMKNEALQEATTITKTEDATVVTAVTEGTSESLAPDAIAFINPEPWRYGEGYKFTGRINAALKSQRGNTESDEVDMDGELGWRWKEDRATIYGQLAKDTSFGVTTTQNWLVTGRYDHFQTEKFYYGANIGFEHDEFADLELRSRIGPHLGYQFYEQDNLNLSTDLGLAYVDEDFISTADDDYMALSWLVNFDWFIIPDHVQFYHRNNGLLSLSDTGDLVINSWTGFPLPADFWSRGQCGGPD